MPRVGGEFVAPFPPVEPDTTIESAVHNGIVADFVIDANAARPITAGGTGATSAAAARTNLQVEVARVQVTNYDSHVWETGSFFSYDGATTQPAPSMHFTGYAVALTPDYATIVARSSTTGTAYVRVKQAGVWGAWVAEGPSEFVNVTGDTMTGHLGLPTLPAEYHAVRRDYVDAADGAVSANANSRVLKSGDTMSGPLIVGNGGTHNFRSKATSGDSGYALLDNSEVERGLVCFQASTGNVFLTNAVAGSHLMLRGADTFFIISHGAAKPGGGVWQDSSDARIKNVLGDYDNGLEAILALQPVRYTFKGNDTGGPPSNVRVGQDPEAASRNTPAVPYPNSGHYPQAIDGTEYIGLIAQDAETVVPECVSQASGYIDGQPVTDLRVLDQGPLVFALINSCKELAARIEALEGAGAARNG